MTRKIVKNKILFLFIPLLFFYSCGIILTGSKPKGVYVKSNIKGAIVLNSEGRKVLGKTPVNINLKATKPLKLLLEKEDYAAANTEIGVKENAGIIFLDAMLLCIPCIPDFITGTVYQYNMDSVFIPMKRIARKDEEVIPISVGDIKWKLKEGETVGKDQEKWAAAEAIINEKHSAFLEASKKVEQQVEKYIAEEVTVDLHPLERENWPELRSLEDEDIIKTYLTQKLIN